ncbi:MAG: diversity-generating retroelement protein Avd [Pseudomonadota bacterium]
MMSTVGVRVEMSARNPRGACLGRQLGADVSEHRHRVSSDRRRDVKTRSDAQMHDNARRTGPALEAHRQFLLWLIPTVEKFPRSQKFLLGDRIQSTALDVLEALIEATYSRDRKAHLSHANLGVEKLRHFVRLAMELHHLDARRYEHAVRALDNVGRLIGGWSKANASYGTQGSERGTATY